MRAALRGVAPIRVPVIQLALQEIHGERHWASSRRRGCERPGTAAGPRRPNASRTATPCSCSSRPPARRAGSRSCRSRAGATRSGSAATGSSASRRRARRRSRTARRRGAGSRPSRGRAGRPCRPSRRPRRRRSRRGAARGGGGRTADDWRASLALYAYPAIGATPVGDVTSGHVLDILKPIWTPKRETARKVKRRISAVMKWAIAKGHRADDPAGGAIDAVLPRSGGEVRHHKALPYGQVAQAVAAREGQQRLGRHQARVRVPGADGGAVRRSAPGDVGRSGRGGRRLDRSGRTDEDGARAQGAVVRAVRGCSARSGGAPKGGRAGVSPVRGARCSRTPR